MYSRYEIHDFNTYPLYDCNIDYWNVSRDLSEKKGYQLHYCKSFTAFSTVILSNKKDTKIILIFYVNFYFGNNSNEFNYMCMFRIFIVFVDIMNNS